MTWKMSPSVSNLRTFLCDDTVICMLEQKPPMQDPDSGKYRGPVTKRVDNMPFQDGAPLPVLVNLLEPIDIAKHGLQNVYIVRTPDVPYHHNCFVFAVYRYAKSYFICSAALEHVSNRFWRSVRCWSVS